MKKRLMLILEEETVKNPGQGAVILAKYLEPSEGGVDINSPGNKVTITRDEIPLVIGFLKAVQEQKN